MAIRFAAPGRHDGGAAAAGHPTPIEMWGIPRKPRHAVQLQKIVLKVPALVDVAVHLVALQKQPQRPAAYVRLSLAHDLRPFGPTQDQRLRQDGTPRCALCRPALHWGRNIQAQYWGQCRKRHEALGGSHPLEYEGTVSGQGVSQVGRRQDRQDCHPPHRTENGVRIQDVRAIGLVLWREAGLIG